ncbi:MAG: hypothetical protein M3247_08325 [Thermoproteota archaeon]|nr:hypothetical protein [Thermoproteota archaeon]
MNSNAVYDDFSSNATLIRNAFKKDLEGVEKDLYDLMNYYLTDRLYIFPKEQFTTDAQYGIPVPYLVYWFANAFHYGNNSVTNQLALTLMYAATFYCIRDDLIDGFIRTTATVNREHAHIALSNFFLSRYLHIFKRMFPQKSHFWYYLSMSLNEWWQHEYWSFSSDSVKGQNLNRYFLSKSFLMNSCKYMIGLSFPSIWALAIKANRQKEFDSIKNFLRYYYLGNRIVDDLRDLEEDLTVKNYNYSSVINYAATFFPSQSRIGQREIKYVFMNEKFTSSVYGSILKYYSKARQCIEHYKSRYLIQFMNDQIEYFTKRRNYYTNQHKDFVSSVLNVLSNSNIH